MAIVRSVCPLNCPDCCDFLAELKENKIHVTADLENMGTGGGFICPKGRALADLVFSPNRLKYPMLKEKKKWKRIDWDEAYGLIEKNIKDTINSYGSQSILHMYDFGHNGALKNLDRRLFQALGGVTEPGGDMCWGAGIEAQKRDFGAVYSSDWEDMLNSKTIILWGRDPAVTNKHLIPLLRKAAKNGTHIIVINPIRVKSTVFANDYIRVNPGTDGILSLGIAYCLLSARWMDFEFVKDNVTNFGPYAALVKEYPPEKVEKITGVPVEKMEELAKIITHNGATMFYLGYGMQRYANGGNTIRAIDALGTITGNIGISGGGVFYAHQYHKENLNNVFLPEDSFKSRVIPHAIMAEELLKKDLKPKINFAYVSRTNPLVTEPNSYQWQELWRRIPFKVTSDLWFSQTAQQSDLILPVTTIFEEEDLLATSWNNKIHYAQKVIEPQVETKTEYEIITELAKRLGFKELFAKTQEQWIDYILEPLKNDGITIEELRKGPIKAPYIPKVAWVDRKFKTPTKKIELIKKEEFMLENTEIPIELSGERKKGKTEKVLYLDDYKIFNNGVASFEYPYYLMTPHPDLAMHSQFQHNDGFYVYLHPQTAKKHNILQGDRAIVESQTGELVATVNISENVHPQVVVIPEGSTENGLGVNTLISGVLSDLGESTSYYDNFCHIRKWNID
ncbi:MAG: molybdopterin-dependent oxidoreductase [Eubacteriales bacterium]